MLKRLSSEDRNLIKEGAIFATLVTGGLAYVNYREWIKKDFLRSEGHYRMHSRTTNITPWKQLYFTWWRMPEEEFNVYHRFKPYFVIGQLDTSKEVLIPATRYDELGNAQKGYNVVNPLYCYEGGRLSFQRAFEKEDPVSIERAAIIVNRGWIPAELKDRRSRTHELSTRKLVKLRGVWRKGKNLHDYKIPNNPDNNEWHNMALEDIGIYWDLPNFDECKHYYFEVVDLDQGEGVDGGRPYPFPLPSTPDSLIDDHYGWKLSQDTNKWAFRVSGALSAASLGVAFLA